MSERQKIRVLSSAERQSEERRLVMPNPGDIIMAMIFGWALFNVMLFSGEGGLLRTVARLAKARSLRDAILNVDVTSIVAISIIGTLIIIGLVVFCYSYRKLMFGVLLFSLAFQNASLKPLHDVALAMKYLIVVFLASFAGMFILKNFWRMVSIPYTRIQLAYFLWIAFVCVAIGGEVTDIWYMGTDLAFVIGLAAAWWAYIEETDQLYEFNMILVVVAFVVTLINATAPLVAERFTESGRFMAYTNGATQFSTAFSPLLLALFWKAMGEEEVVKRNIYTCVAILGLILLLWSGSRGGVIGLMLGIYIMWRVFRTRILAYLIAMAVLGLTAQIVGGENQESVEKLSGRLSGLTENIGRLDLWASQMEYVVASPIYGTSPTGRSKAQLRSSTVKFLERYGLGEAYAKPVHNSFLGLLIKFGVVGLLLLLALMYKPMLRAKTLVFSDKMPYEDKSVFVLVAAMSVTMSFILFFEDALSSTGRGTINGAIFFTSLFILDKMGKKYEAQYLDEKVESKLHKAHAKLLHSDS